MTILLMLIFVCLIFSACGTKEKSQYDEATNQKISFHGISFQVPKAWEKPEIEMDKNTIAFSQGLEEKKGLPVRSLMATFEQNNNIKERIVEIKFGWDINGKNPYRISNLEESEINIAGMKGKSFEYNQVTKGEKGNAKYVILQNEKDFIEISFYSNDSVGMEDFNRVIDSIEKTKV